MKRLVHQITWLLFAIAQSNAAVAATCPGPIGSVGCIYSTIEPGGSRGSQSMTIGLSAVEGRIPERVENTPNLNPDGGLSDSPASSVLRAIVTKGTPLPLDIGAILAATPDGSTQQVGAHLQWTLFEGFRLPAISARTSWLRTDWSEAVPGVQISRRISATTKAIELVGSLGIWGVLTPYAGVGIATSGPSSSTVKTAGIEIQAAPPFLRIGIESRSAFNDHRTMAKISIGL